MTDDAQEQCQKLAYEIEQMEAKLQTEIAWFSRHEAVLAELCLLTENPDDLAKEILQLRSGDDFSRALRSTLCLPIALVRLEQAKKQLASLRGQVDASGSP